MTFNTVENLYDDDEIVINDEGISVLVVPRSERFIRSRLNYEIEIKDDTGNWFLDIVIPDDNGRSYHFYTTNMFTNNDGLNQLIDSFIKRALTIYLPKSLSSIQESFEYFASAYTEKEGDLARSFEKCFTNLARDGRTDSIGPLKKFISYLVASEVENFDIDAAAELAGATVGGKQNQYMKLFTMDSEAGPFTREELAVIDQAIANDDAPLDSRCIMGICREWGLRPIQLSLLKVSDFNYNPQNKQYWLNVPRVKQKVKARRQEFRLRLLPHELGEMIDQMIESDQWIVREYEQADPPLFQRHYNRNADITGDLILRSEAFDSASNPHARLYTDDRKDYQHHVPTTSIDWRLHQMERFMPLSPRTGNSFNLTPYRFRYTLGTASVLEGMTAPEVADRLDHSSIDCVKHYFKNTREFWELIEKATASRVEQKYFAAAFMTKEPNDENNIYATDITEKTLFTSIGKCHKGSPCSLEPAVACYGCKTFKPNDNIEGHEAAKEVIKKMDERQKNLSSEGHIQHVYEEALAGVEAAIMLSSGEHEVVGIYDSSPQPFGLETELGMPKLESES